MAAPSAAGETLRLGRWTATVRRDTPFHVDAASLFHLIPRPLWRARAEPDARDRLPVALNSLLLQDGETTVLLDAGIGDRYSLRDERLYGLDRSRSLLAELAAVGVAPEAVDLVVLTHLHLDHTGWCQRAVEGGLAPTFPNADYVVQEAAWRAAHATNELTRGSYRLADLDGLEAAGRLRRVAGEATLAPGLRVVETGAHAPGHQILLLEAGGRTLCCPAELAPDTLHLRLSWVMCYDERPVEVVERKRELLARALAGEWLVFLSHEMGPALGTLAPGPDEETFLFSPLPAAAPAAASRSGEGDGA
jgi:glyoxylase-like metal-dependent hydrolase (beta-lactamase superfamily II)